MFLSEWREFPSAPCLAGKKKSLMTARASMLLKSRASLTCFQACILPGRAKDLSAPRHVEQIICFFCVTYSKGKAVPLQAWSGPEGSRKLKFPDFMCNGTE